MGYCVSMEIDNLSIPQKNIEGCLASINAMFENTDNMSGGSSDSPRYAFVNSPPGHTFDSLIDALDDWRYAAQYKDEDIFITEFTGEKCGDDELLYDVIAEFIEEPATIHYLGEDGYRWKYVFEDGTYQRIE